MGVSCCGGGHRHLQQAVVLAFAGHAVAVLRGPLDEFHAHFVLLELHQKPAGTDTSTTALNSTQISHPQGGDGNNGTENLHAPLLV